MSLNGSGVYVVNSAGQPVVANTLITSAAFNAFTADMATAMSTAIMKDGQQTVTANVPFGGFKLTGVGAATARTDAATIATFQDGTGVYVATVGGTADAITLTPAPAITAYAAGQTFRFIASGANTTNVTVQISGLASPKAITKNGTTALVAGDIPSAAMVTITYDGTRFILGTIGAATHAVQPFTDATAIIKGSADTSKLLRIEVDGLTTATTRVLTPPDQDLTLSNIWVGVNDFRLSLTTALPVTTADVTAAGTLYCVPYTGNRIALFDGTNWVIRNSAEFNLALTATSGKPYDVWCYDNAGTPTLETTVWTNDTTRATALAYQNGVLVKSGTATRRYLGTLYSSGANTTEDSFAKRYLWNYYHRITRSFKVVDTTNAWTCGVTVWRQANASSLNQADLVVGVAEDAIEAHVRAFCEVAASSLVVAVGIGLNSTTVNSAQIYGITTPGSNRVPLTAHYSGVPPVGRVQVVWLEFATAGDTTTMYGDNGSAFIQSGLVGTMRG